MTKPVAKKRIARRKKGVPTVLPLLPNGKPLDPKYWQKYEATSRRKMMHTNETTGQEEVVTRIVCSSCLCLPADCCCWTHLPCKHTTHLKQNPGRGQSVCENQQHCQFCCNHRKCQRPKCGRVFEVNRQNGYPAATKKCMGCAQCPEHCECRACTVCGTPGIRKKTFCACGGDHHPHCCETDEQIDAIGARPYYLKRAIQFQEGKPVRGNRLRRLLSIESEVSELTPTLDANVRRTAYINFNRNARTWRQSVVEEGTCPHGWETNFSPASGDKFIRQIKDTVVSYNALQAKTGVRCGMHVHVDARDITYAHLHNVIELYARIEPALYALLPPWRRINRFCVPSGDYYMSNIVAAAPKKAASVIYTITDPDKYNRFTPTDKEPEQRYKSSIAMNLMSSMYGGTSLRQHKKVHKNGNNQRLRYMALNLHSWVYQRTIEFRHYPGTLDEEPMILWPQVCGAIIERALRWSPERTRAMKGDPYEILLEVVKPASWLSSDVKPFVERLMAKWTNDDWRYLKTSNNAAPVFPQGKYGVGFDMTNMLYTFIKPEYIAWETQWSPLPPKLSKDVGRYVTAGDVASSLRGASLYLAGAEYPVHIYPQPLKKDAPLTPTPGPMRLGGLPIAATIPLGPVVGPGTEPGTLRVDVGQTWRDAGRTTAQAQRWATWDTPNTWQHEAQPTPEDVAPQPAPEPTFEEEDFFIDDEYEFDRDE